VLARHSGFSLVKRCLQGFQGFAGVDCFSAFASVFEHNLGFPALLPARAGFRFKGFPGY
jgi:hypothetical protein